MPAPKPTELSPLKIRSFEAVRKPDAQPASKKPAKKSRPGTNTSLAGSTLKRGPLIETLRRLEVDPKSVSAEIRAQITTDKPIPSSDKYTKRFKNFGPAVRLDIGDTDSGLKLAPDYSKDQSPRFQRTAFDPKFAKLATAIVGDGPTSFSVGFEPVEHGESRRGVWWFDGIDGPVFERLCQHWIDQAGTNKRLLAKARLDRDILIEYFQFETSDEFILASYDGEFEAIKKGSQRVRTVGGFRAYRKRLFEAASEFFRDETFEPNPTYNPRRDPTYPDRRQRYEFWKDVREGPDRFVARKPVIKSTEGS